MKLLLANLYLLMGLMLGGFAASTSAQIAPSADSLAPRAGPEFRPEVGQGTNAVTAREVTGPGSRGWQRRVFFVKRTGEALAGWYTNRVCFLNGRLFRVEPRTRGFSANASEPVDGGELTEAKAIEVATESLIPGRIQGGKRIDLKVLLKREADLPDAGPRDLQEVAIRPQGTNLVVSFVSFSGLEGSVALDQEFNVLSMELTGSKK
jgi:hypothetical protein